MPYGDRNSRSSSMTVSTRRSRSPSTIASSRRSPSPGVRMQATFAGQVGPVLDEPVHAAAERRRACPSASGSSVCDGEQRDQADQRADPQRDAAVVRRVQHVVEEAVLLVPEVVPFAAVLTAAAHRVRDVEEVLPELARDVLVGGVRDARARWRWPACSANTSPSSSCRRTARGARRSAAARCGRRRRCCRGRGSRPGRRSCPRRPCGSPTR